MKTYPYWILGEEDFCPHCFNRLALRINLETLPRAKEPTETVDAEKCPRGCYERYFTENKAVRGAMGAYHA